MFNHILIPTDGSELSQKAVDKGIEFAKSIGARMTCVHVTPPVRSITQDGFAMPLPEVMKSRYADEQAQYARKVLDSVQGYARRAGVVCSILHVTSDSPYEAIIGTANTSGCDLILMASHGRRGVHGLLLGSETVKVLMHADIPVLVYRESRSQERESRGVLACESA